MITLERVTYSRNAPQKDDGVRRRGAKNRQGSVKK